MNPPFSSHLQSLRTSARLTNAQLARLAGVPESLISGLQNDKRRIGEYQARKVAKALRLSGEELEQFVFQAIDTSTEKVLCEAKGYPAQLLNLLAMQLKEAGIRAESICGFSVAGDPAKQEVTLTLNGGGTATLQTQLFCTANTV